MQVCARSHTCAQSRHLFEVGKVDGEHPPSPGEPEGRRPSRGERGRRRAPEEEGREPCWGTGGWDPGTHCGPLHHQSP